MRWAILAAFFALFAAWAVLEITRSDRQGLQEALFWGAMTLVLLSGFDFRPRRKTADKDKADTP